MYLKKILNVSLSIILIFLAIPIVSVTAEDGYVKKEEAIAAPTNPQFLGESSSSATGYIPGPIKITKTSPSYTILKGSVADPVFDLRDPNLDLNFSDSLLTPIKDQGSIGSCWSFAALGSLEGNLKVRGSTDYDFSENNMIFQHGFDLGPNDGGNDSMATAYLARWGGPVSEVVDPYPNPPEAINLVDRGTKSPEKHVQEVIMLADRAAPTDNADIKSVLVNYGPVSAAVKMSGTAGAGGDIGDIYSASTYSLHNYAPSTPDHEIVLIGWDDNYLSTNFLTAPAGDGAFIARNSWGTSWGDGGYFYISYYDTSLQDFFVFVNGESTNNYDYIYSYDDLGWVTNLGYGSNTAWFANMFTPQTSFEELAAVSLYTPGYNSAYEVYVIANSTPVQTYVGWFDLGEKGTAVATGTFSLPGYHTINLSTPVTLGSNPYAVIVKLTTPGYDFPLAVEKYSAGYSTNFVASTNSYMSSDSNFTAYGDMEKQTELDVCLKAFTTLETTPPTLSSATVTGTTLTLTYNEALDPVSVPLAGDFSVTVNSNPISVTNVAVSGTSVTLTLQTAVVLGDSVAISYTKALNPPIKDLAGNAAADLIGQVVTNVTETTPPVLSSVGTSVITPATLAAKSNENGTLYLVDKAFAASYGNYATKANLDSAVAAGKGTSIAATANVLAAIPTTGLKTGTYSVYAVDMANNRSTASGNVTVTDGEKPTLSGVGTSVTTPATLAATSNEDGTVYLVDKAYAATYGNYANKTYLDSAVTAGKGKKITAVAGTPVAILTTGLKAGTYSVYAVDAASNRSDASADVAITDGEVPTLSNVSTTVTTPNNVVATSNEAGTVYLVNKSEAITYNNYAAKTDLENAVTAGKGKKATATANVAVSIPTTGLNPGTYTVYAVDTADNISIPSADVALLDGVGPILSNVGTVVTTPATLAATSNENGTFYLVDKAYAASYGNYATKANLDSAVAAGKGSSIAAVANTPVAIPTAGLKAGTYSVYAVDVDGNRSLASGNVTVTDGEIPTLSNVGIAVTTPATLAATSNEAGTVYLVDKNEAVNYGNYATKTNLDSAVTAGKGKKITAVAGTPVAIPTTGLKAGTYTVYAVDAANNRSDASADVDVSDGEGPVLSNVGATVKTPSALAATSSENGTFYLVDKAFAASYGNYATKANLDSAVVAGKGTSTAATENTPATIPTAGLKAGTYSVYAVDTANNRSTASGNVTVTDGEKPTLSGVDASVKTPATLAAKSNENGTVYLVDKAYAASYGGYASKTYLDSAVTAGKGKKIAATADSEVLIPTTGLMAGTYSVYAVDLASNRSDAADVTVSDGEPPVLAGTSVNGSTLTLLYNETLDGASTPVTTDFSVTNGSDNVNVTNVAISGKTATLTLETASKYGDSVKISYTKGTNPIQDVAGNIAANLSNQAVANTAAAPYSPSFTAPVNTNDDEATLGDDKTIPIDIDNSGNASVDVNWTDLTNALNSSGNSVVLNIPAIEGANSYTTEIPGYYFKTEKQNNIQVNTDNGTINVPSNMLNNQEVNVSSKFGINIGQADISTLPSDVAGKIGNKPLISLTLTVDGQQQNWNNPDSPVTVSIPYTPAPGEDLEHIVVWYIDGSGNIVEIPSGKYDPVTGTVIFQTTHFSNYAVAYVEKTFSDIKSVNWAIKQIEVLASKGIIQGTTETTYSPNKNISRADYLLYLVNTLNLTAEFNSNFTDIKPTDYYYEAIGIAKELGVTTGKGNNTFGPNDEITRQDMMTLTVRALNIAGKLNSTSTATILNSFKDKSQIADYAMKSVATLVSEQLIIGSNNLINPRGNTTRAEAAVLLYRIYNKY